MRNIAVAILSLLVALTHAQELTGPQSQPGYSFTIPAGWVGEAQDGSYALVSGTASGMILLGPTAYASMQAMHDELAAPAEDGAGTSMRPVEGPTARGGNTVFVIHEGTMEGAPMKLVAIGTWNANGETVTVAGLASPDQFTGEFVAVVEQVHAGLIYTATGNAATDVAPRGEAVPPTEPDGPVDEEWRQLLSGYRLRYMESYSSPSGSGADGLYGGYSIDRVIDLCPEGHFKARSNSEHNIGGSSNEVDVGSVGQSGSSNQGTWQVLKNGNGASVLRLRYQDGGLRDYRLTMENDLTYLNGERWRRLNAANAGAENAPDCP